MVAHFVIGFSTDGGGNHHDCDFMLCICAATLLNGRVHTDYYPAYTEARKSGKMLLIDFGTGFDFSSVDSKKLDGYVLCRVPLEYTLTIDGKREADQCAGLRLLAEAGRPGGCQFAGPGAFPRDGERAAAAVRQRRIC